MKKIILLITFCSISLFSCKSGGETNNSSANNDKEKELLEREKALLEKENASLKDNNQKSSEQSSQNRSSQEQSSPRQETQHPQPNFSYNQRYLSYNHKGSGVNEYLFIANGTPFYYSPNRKVYMEMEENMNVALGEGAGMAYPNEVVRTYKFKNVGGNDGYALIYLKSGNVICMDFAGDKQTYIPF